MALQGRTAELKVLAGLLQAAKEGRGGALVVRGLAGIGKSALVEAATAHASGFTVLHATGTEFEADLPFAGLHQLCQPVLKHLSALPAPQATALGAALGLDVGSVAPDASLLVGAGLLSLLGAAAKDRPLICVIDDAQWLDPSTTAVTAFAARRLEALPIAIIAIVRDEDDREAGPDALAPLPQLRLSGLGDREARELLATEVRAPLDPRVRDRIIAEARGNPLALLELPRTAGSAALAGGYEVPGSSVSSALEAGFQQRLSLLPPAAQTFTALAAAEATGDPDLLRRAAREMDLPDGAPEPAEESGLLSLGARVRFRHPLVRSAVYHATPLGERRAVHRALAAATDPEVDPDRRAWHLALAATGPDERVASELERSADRAQLRGGIAAAAAFLERAALLTPDPTRRGGRLLQAAAAKRAAGALEPALQLVAAAEGTVLDPGQRAAAVALRARTAIDQRRGDGTIDLLLEAARALAATNPAAAREALLEAFAVAAYAGRFAPAGALAEIMAVARDLPVGEGPGAGAEVLFDGLLVLATSGRAQAAGLLRQGVDLSLAGQDGHLSSGVLWMAGSAAHELWDEESFRLLAERQLTQARSTGAVATLILTLGYQAVDHLHTGDFVQAQSLAEETHRVADDLGGPRMLTVDVAVAAWRGDEDRTVAIARAAVDDAEPRREGRVLTVVEYSVAVLRNAQGRYVEALEALGAGGPATLEEQDIRVWILPEVVEAAVRAGRLELAATAHERLRDGEEVLDSDWVTGMTARSAALLTEGADAEGLYRSALEHLSRTRAAPQLARTHLVFGEWLRRVGRRGEAREQLRTALEAFAAMGAQAFAARATRELAIIGERPRTRGAGIAALSAQELQVARSVAAGATSKEVAAQLFLSPRTIDAHLRSIFAKLAITSRRQLRDVSLPADPQEQPATTRTV